MHCNIAGKQDQADYTDRQTESRPHGNLLCEAELVITLTNLSSVNIAIFANYFGRSGGGSFAGTGGEALGCSTSVAMGKAGIDGRAKAKEPL